MEEGEYGNGLSRDQRFLWLTFVLVDTYTNDWVKKHDTCFLCVDDCGLVW